MKKFSIGIFLFLVVVIFAFPQVYSRTEPVVLSAGGGVSGSLYFAKDDGDNYRYRDFKIRGYFDGEFFSFVLFEAALYAEFGTNTTTREYYNWRDLGLDFSLFGQYPFEVNYGLTVAPILGFGYKMLFLRFDDEWELYTRGDFYSPDSLWLRFGGGLNYDVSRNTRLNARLLYNIFLYSKWASEYRADGNKYSEHGPSLFLGISRLF